MPFAPSRLSAAYSHDDTEAQEEEKGDDERLLSAEEPQQSHRAIMANAGAIDIPNSPRPFNPGYRRSSSAQRNPLPSEDDISDLYGMRSASMGTQGAQNILKRQQATATPPVPNNLKRLNDTSSLEENRVETMPETAGGLAVQDGMVSDSGSTRSSVPNVNRSRYPRAGLAVRGSHASPGQGSLSSIGGTGASAEKAGDSGSASSSWARGGRPQGLTRPESKTGDDDDFLPFVMDASTFAANRGDGKPKNASDR